MSADSSNRTLVLSVVAVDLVGYSRKSVAEQMSLKDNFNQVLLRAIRDIPVADRIILDTGDGVAMGFLGDPEDALYVAMFMHDAVNRNSAGRPPVGVDGRGTGNAIRIGINLGPVKLATGIGGHPNIIGDGINVAERIMGFAEPGQFTASRPFFEVMSRMSGQYANLFQYAGVHTDKQVRAHDVYLVGKSVAAFQQAEQGVAERAAQRVGQPAISPALPVVATVVSPTPANSAAIPSPTPAPALAERHSGLIDFLENRKKVTTTAGLLAVVAVALGATIAYRNMRTNAAESSVPVVAALSPAPASQEGNATAVPSPAPVVASRGPTSVVPSKAEAKSPPSTANVVTAPSAAAKSAIAPGAAIPGPGRDKPTDAKIENPARADRPDKVITRDDIRNEPRKVPPPRSIIEGVQSAPITAAPVVPTYQSPIQAPRPESVAPTPSLPPPAMPRVDTSVVVVARSEPSYPVEGIRQGIVKRVVVKARLTIDASGSVGDVNILEGGPIAAFARETRTTLKQWKFNPGTPARTYDIELTFNP